MRICWLLLVVLLGCQGRLPLATAYEDALGHRLYLFNDSVYIASVDNIPEQFYRRPRWSFGTYRSMADGIQLESNWPRTIHHWITQDSLCERGMCVRFVDRKGHALRFWSTQVTDNRDSILQWSDGYSMFYTAQWNDPLILTDADGMIDRKQLVFPDTSKHGCIVHLDMDFFDLDERLLLRDFHLVRRASGFAPIGPFTGLSDQDPHFGAFNIVALSKRDRAWIERRGWNLKRCGHPDRRCPVKGAWWRFGPMKAPMQ